MINEELMQNLDSRFSEIRAGKNELTKRIAMHAINAYAIKNPDAFMGSMTAEGESSIDEETAEELSRQILDVAGTALNEWFGVDVYGGSNWRSDAVVEFFLGETHYSLKKSLVGREFNDETASSIASGISNTFGQIAANPIATAFQDIPTKNEGMDKLENIIGARGVRMINKDDIDGRMAMQLWQLHNSGELYSDRALNQLGQYVKRSYN